MGQIIPEPNHLYQELPPSHLIVCFAHAQGKTVMEIDHPTGKERCWYCLRTPTGATDAP